MLGASCGEWEETIFEPWISSVIDEVIKLAKIKHVAGTALVAPSTFR